MISKYFLLFHFVDGLNSFLKPTDLKTKRNNEGGCACVWTGSMWEISVSFSQFFCDPKTVLKKMKSWGRGRVSCDKVREWHGHIYTTKREIDS